MVENLLTMCSYCDSVKDPNTGKFIGVGDPNYDLLVDQYKDSISHSACEPCGKKVKEEIRQFKESRLAKKV